MAHNYAGETPFFLKPFVGGEPRPGNLHKQSCPCKQTLHKLSSPCRNNDQNQIPKIATNSIPPERRLRVCGNLSTWSPSANVGSLFSLYPRIRLSQRVDLANFLPAFLRVTGLTVLNLLIELHAGVQHLPKDQPLNFWRSNLTLNSGLNLTVQSLVNSSASVFCNLGNQYKSKLQ